MKTQTLHKAQHFYQHFGSLTFTRMHAESVRLGILAKYINVKRVLSPRQKGDSE